MFGDITMVNEVALTAPGAADFGRPLSMSIV
jgi:hypothetical protein